MARTDDRLLVQIASYNTNLQGNLGLPQDLVDWLSPTLKVSNFLSHDRQSPDIVAVGFQELLPLHFALSGLSRKVIESRDALIRTQIETHAPDKSRYALVAKVVNVGIALLVYARDDNIAPRIRDVQTQWTGSGPGYMGNKGAVGVRFRLTGLQNEPGETFTFVNAHLTAHSQYLQKRIADYHHIVGTLLFPPPPSAPKSDPFTTMYQTSHLFFSGDLNFRLALPSTHRFSAVSSRSELVEALNDDLEREALKEFDELLLERNKGTVFTGFREGEFWRFKCTYKYRLKEVDRYNISRLPAWTDRIMFTTYSDSSVPSEKSNIEPILYTSIPSYTSSDHKPIVALLFVPSSTSQSSGLPPTLQLPSSFSPSPDPYWRAKRYVGRSLDRLVGYIWTLLWLVGLGNAALGIGNFFIGLAAWRWMQGRTLSSGSEDIPVAT